MRASRYHAMRPIRSVVFRFPGRRIGVAIGPTRIRVVRQRGVVRSEWSTMVLEWDGVQLEPVVDLIRARLGRADAVAVAIDPDALFVKRVTLPPVSLPERRRMLMLEPERFFPLRGRDVIAAPQADDTLVFAAESASLEAWLRVLEGLGPIESVEPSPVAIARALGQRGVSDAVVVIPAGPGATAGVRLVAGGLADVRKVRGDWRAAAAAVGGSGETPVLLAPGCEGATSSSPDTAALPPLGRVAAEFAAALGALLGLDRSRDAALMPHALIVRARARRARRMAGAVAAAALALVFALTSVAHYRERVLEQIDRDIAALEAPAATVLDEQAHLEQLARWLSLVDSARADRPDPLAVLLALTEALPRDAHLRSLHVAGETWEIDGAAADAAQLIPTLERSPVMADVRFRGATSRLRDGTRVYDEFSLAFRYVPAP